MLILSADGGRGMDILISRLAGPKIEHKNVEVKIEAEDVDDLVSLAALEDKGIGIYATSSAVSLEELWHEMENHWINDTDGMTLQALPELSVLSSEIDAAMRGIENMG